VVDKYQREMDAGLRRGVPGFRATGFTDLDQGQDEWRQWLRYEAAVNRIFADYPFRALCLWDSRRLPAERAKAYRAAHPGLVGPSGLRPNGEYVAPEELVSRPEHRPRPDPAQAGPPQYDADVGDDLRHLRLDLYPVALSSQMRSDALDDFIKAVGGVVLNACAHGSGNVRVRLWAPPHKLVCTVTDRGPGIDDPFVGYGKPAVKSPREAPGNGGLGMWAARQLCDRLDYGSGPEGFTVRLVSRD
jgi:anti-sigma regulatory factor (Ser/Thr protein kinase)